MNRPGVSLPEMLIVAWLFGAILLAVAGFAGAQGRLVARAHDRSRAEAVARTARLVLGAELRALAPADIAALSQDSVRLRAVRGSGPVCQAEGSAVFVRYRGVRQPDARKDSVLVIREDRTEGRSYRLLRANPDGRCGGTMRLELDRAAAPAGWALVFETGAYHLSNRALRYRRGAGGRQPLTETLLRAGRLQPVRGGLRMELRFDLDSLPRLGPATSRLTIRLANTELP